MVSGWLQGGTINIYKDATIVGNGNHCVYLNTDNTKCQQITNIYGGNFSGGDIYIDGTKTTSTKYVTDFKLMGGNVQSGITVVGNATVSISGTPAVSGAGLKLADGVTVTLGELESGTSIAVDATGAFTAANSNAKTYLNAGYFTAVQPGYGIEAINNILYCRETA